jgi:antitoxin component HigA of HigAB toxin-antitoxin module
MKSIHSFMILQTMDIRPIHTGADYKATLKEISALTEMDPAAGTLRPRPGAA